MLLPIRGMKPQRALISASVSPINRMLPQREPAKTVKRVVATGGADEGEKPASRWNSSETLSQIESGSSTSGSDDHSSSDPHRSEATSISSIATIENQAAPPKDKIQRPRHIYTNSLSSILPKLKARSAITQKLRISLTNRLKHLARANGATKTTSTLALPTSLDRFDISLHNLVSITDSTQIKRLSTSTSSTFTSSRRCHGIRVDGRLCSRYAPSSSHAYCAEPECQVQSSQCLWLTHTGVDRKAHLCRLEAQNHKGRGRGGREQSKHFCKIHGTMLNAMLDEIERVSSATLASLRVLEKFVDALFLEQGRVVATGMGERGGVAKTGTSLSGLTPQRQAKLEVDCIVCLEPVELDVKDGGFDCQKMWHAACMSRWLALDEDLEELKYLPSL